MSVYFASVRVALSVVSLQVWSPIARADASTSAPSFWEHIIDRVADVVLHATFTTALLLVALAALAVAATALWTLQVVVRTLLVQPKRAGSDPRNARGESNSQQRSGRTNDLASSRDVKKSP